MMALLLIASSVFSTSAVFATDLTRGCEQIGTYESGDGVVYTFDCDGTYIDVIIYDDGHIESHVLR